MVERITDSTPRAERHGHEFRYHLAAGYLEPGDTVIDAACGVGYGMRILAARGDIEIIGVDRIEVTGAIRANLETWEPDFPFDAFVGFETVEHLDDYTHYLSVAKRARRVVLLSVPVIPTVHSNQYHRHDFGPGQLSALFADDRWECVQTVSQPSEVAEIYVFMRRDR